ncbi:MAG: cytochrome c3 family protein [Pseudomonadota bacterium]
MRWPPLPIALLWALLLWAVSMSPLLAEWAGSETCHSCHRDRYSTWHRTYHRTMTQEATPENVQGRFDGRTILAWGMEVRPVRRGDRFFFDYYTPGASQPVASYQIERLVGSHRYQQYLTKEEGDGGTFYRLHMLWHNEDQRWVHMNAAFLGPDEQNFDANVSVWNHNCIFCHNTGPQPGVVNYEEMQARAAMGQAVNSADEARYESEVSEMGIACEACHGPSELHVQRQSNWLTRLSHTLTGQIDDSVVLPTRLDKDRANMVCGQCHGQRLPVDGDMLRRFIGEGPVYRAGDDLFESVELVWPETPNPMTGHPDDLFGMRFWPDRTPRLTAYEYQGVQLSKCHDEAELTCMTCHTMHSGDRHGMIREEARGNGPCLTCHMDLAEDIEAHTFHPADSAGSNCYSCHMPEIVYGVMEIHRSHRIEVPDPAANAADSRPNACNLCHLDPSVVWAENETARLWGREAKPVVRADGVDPHMADGVARLLAGDPVERAVTATAIGRAVEGGQLEHVEAWQPLLMEAMKDDYPAVRRFARRSLEQTAQAVPQTAAAIAAFTDDFDFIGAPGARTSALADLMVRYALLDLGETDGPRVEELQLERMRQIGVERSEAINIGE